LDNYSSSKIKSAFFNDIAQGILKTYSVTPEIIIRAIEILDSKYLTPLDSIQVATTLQIEHEKGSIIFVVSDKKLCSFVQQYGLKCLFI